MKTSHLVLALVASAAFTFALVGEAGAQGACVYLKNESFQCADRISNDMSCKKKAPGGLGEFHDGTTCKKIGHGVTWGLASPPAPPAKADFSGVSFTMKTPAGVPPIPSPFAKSKRTTRF